MAKTIYEIASRKYYPDKLGKAPDWVIVDGTTAVLIECKATRFGRPALVTGDEDAVNEDLQKQVVTGLKQLHQFMEACKAKGTGIEQLDNCTSFKPVLATLEPLYLINSKPFREHIDGLLVGKGVATFDWLVLSMDELERLQPHLATGISLGETIDKLHNSRFDAVLEELHTQTALTYKDSFLYSKEEELYQLLGVADKLLDDKT